MNGAKHNLVNIKLVRWVTTLFFVLLCSCRQNWGIFRSHLIALTNLHTFYIINSKKIGYFCLNKFLVVPKFTLFSFCLFCCCSIHIILSLVFFFLFWLQVSWIRKRDLHILTAGVLTYTSDERFQVRIQIYKFTNKYVNVHASIIQSHKY